MWGMNMNLNYYVKILKALGDPSRLKLLKILSEKELCVCEIEEVMNMKQTTVSQQLRKLKEAEIVIERKEGWWSYYSLNREILEEFFDAFRDFIFTDIEKLEEFKPEEQRINGLEENIRIIKCKKREFLD
jgi:ArsR family transcriptional regulator